MEPCTVRLLASRPTHLLCRRCARWPLACCRPRESLCLTRAAADVVLLCARATDSYSLAAGGAVLERSIDAYLVQELNAMELGRVRALVTRRVEAL